MKYVIGIDSGGTNYRVQAKSLDSKVLGEYIGNYASNYALPEEEIKRRINHHIDKCLTSFSGKREDCEFLVCGTTGLDSEEDNIYLNDLYKSLEKFHCPMVVKNDAELAHYTVTGGTGILVISGTGSIAFGVNSHGESRRVGGWALSIMGEEGSGTWVTRKAIRHLARSFDKVVGDSLLTDMIKKKLVIRTAKDMMDYSVRLTMNAHEQVSLAEVVDYAAEQGDKNAVNILKAAAKETFGAANDLIKVLGMKEDPEIVVGIWGSNIVKSRTHQEEFERLLKEKYHQAYVKKPTKSALNGATKMALELLNEGARGVHTS